LQPVFASRYSDPDVHRQVLPNHFSLPKQSLSGTSATSLQLKHSPSLISWLSRGRHTEMPLLDTNLGSITLRLKILLKRGTGKQAWQVNILQVIT
jgi:hypothetical protein